MNFVIDYLYEEQRILKESSIIVNVDLNERMTDEEQDRILKPLISKKTGRSVIRITNINPIE